MSEFHKDNAIAEFSAP